MVLLIIRQEPDIKTRAKGGMIPVPEWYYLQLNKDQMLSHVQGQECYQYVYGITYN